MSAFSVSVRVRRVTTEEGYVSVPVTDAVLQDEPHPDGTRHLDGGKVMAEAVRRAAELARWNFEEQQITLHPVQKAPE